jgi:tetratricopeptide (TPR) repeat protein
MIRARLGLIAAAFVGCTTPLDIGEKLYREGDPLGALQTWRAIGEDESSYEASRQRLAEVETEFDQLVVRYKLRARYFEAHGRLAEAILNARLAVELQPDDAATIAHVQELARALKARKREEKESYHQAFGSGDFADAERALQELRSLDPFDLDLEPYEREFRAAVGDAVARLIEEGERHFLDGQPEIARERFGAVLELDPDNESARGYLSYIDSSLEKLERGIGRKSRATVAQVRAEGFFQNALAAQERDDAYAAIRYDLRALGADPEHTRARRHLRETRSRLAPGIDELIDTGRAHFRNEDLHSALDSWQRALLVDPRNARAKAYADRAEREIEDLERLRSEPAVSAGVPE